MNALTVQPCSVAASAACGQRCGSATPHARSCSIWNCAMRSTSTKWKLAGQDSCRAKQKFLIWTQIEILPARTPAAYASQYSSASKACPEHKAGGRLPKSNACANPSP